MAAGWERIHHRKVPSFSTSLLDAVYRSIDEPGAGVTRHASARVEDEIESLRRAIRVEKWMQTSTTHACSVSRSSFPPAEASSKSSLGNKACQEVKKAKQPVSPGARIFNFLNSIFAPRKKQDWSAVTIKSRSMKDPGAVRGRNKPRGDEFQVRDSVARLGNMHSLKDHHKLHGYYKDDSDIEERSRCSSSDLFELDIVGHVRQQGMAEELPVYGTTNIGIHKTMANGFFM